MAPGRSERQRRTTRHSAAAAASSVAADDSSRRRRRQLQSDASADYLDHWRDLHSLLRPALGTHWMSHTLASGRRPAGGGNDSALLPHPSSLASRNGGGAVGRSYRAGANHHDDDEEEDDDDEEDDEDDGDDEGQIDDDEVDGEFDGLELDMASRDEYKYFNAQHNTQLMSGLNWLRHADSLCDVTLCVNDRRMSAHRCVLAASSAYFKAMFSQQMRESEDGVVEMKSLDADTLELLLTFIYTGVVRINQNNVQQLTSATNLLQILPVKAACCLYMERHMDASNAVGIHCFAETMDCARLSAKALRFCLSHFDEIACHDEFLQMSAERLVALVSDDYLTVSCEEAVLSAVLAWLQSQPCERQPVLHQVLQHVRLPLMSPYFLHDCVAQQEAITSSEQCRNLLEEAKLYHLLPDRRSYMQSERTRPRRSAKLIEVIVCLGGEDDRVVLKSVEALQPSTKGWTPLESLPHAISKHSCVVCGRNVLYLAGGEFPNGTASGQLFRFDPVLDAWQQLDNMHTPRSELGMAVLDGFIYVVGGWDGSKRLASVERYCMASNTWEMLSPLAAAITSACVAAHNGLLYVAGGAVGEDGDGISSVQRYDPRTAAWSNDVANMLIPRSGSACVVLANKIYVLGGWHGSTENTNKVECYDIAANQWTACPPMKEKRYRPGATVVDGCIYVLGGEEGWDLYHNSGECWRPTISSSSSSSSCSDNDDQAPDEQKQWCPLPVMSTPRSWLACVTLQVKESLLL